MKKNNFIIVFLATIIIIRILLYLVPRTSFLYTDKFHHIYIGIILLAIYYLIKNQYVLAISLGLIVDQITAIPSIINKSIVQYEIWAYWSTYSIISTIIATIISVILIKKYKK